MGGTSQFSTAAVAAATLLPQLNFNVIGCSGNGLFIRLAISSKFSLARSSIIQNYGFQNGIRTRFDFVSEMEGTGAK